MIKAVVIEDNIGALRKITLDYLQKNNISREDIQELTSYVKGCTSTTDIFGKNRFVLLNLTEDKDLKKFIEFIDKEKKYVKTNAFVGNGIAIMLSKRRGATPVINLISKTHNGEVIESKGDIDALLSDINITADAKEFIKQYVGDEHYMVINIINSLPKNKNTITIDDVLLALPSKPGAVPPWEFIGPLTKGNIEESLLQLDRIMINSHPMVPFSILKKKIDLIMDCSILYHHKYNKNEIAKELNISNPRSLYFIEKVYKKPLPTVFKIAMIMYELECNLKNGFKLPEQAIRNSVIEIGNLIR